MALETIDGDTGGNMTAGTKVFAAVYPCNPAIFSRCGVTIDAAGKTRLFGTNTLMYRPVALVQEDFHVRAPHLVYWCNTGFTFGRRYNVTLVIAARTRIFRRKRLTAQSQ